MLRVIKPASQSRGRQRALHDVGYDVSALSDLY